MATTINGTSVLDPYQVSITRQMIGGGERSANGTFLLDYASTTLKRKVVLSWRLLTSAQRTSILAKVADCITAARTLVLPDSTSITVIYDPDTEPTETMVRDFEGFKYNLQVAFVEE